MMTRLSVMVLLVGSAGAFAPFSASLRGCAIPGSRGRLGSAVPTSARMRQAATVRGRGLELRMGITVDDVTTLMDAAQDGDAAKVRSLIAEGIDVNIKQLDENLRLTEVKLDAASQDGGTTALHLASMFGHAEDRVDYPRGMRVLHLASMFGYAEVVKLLLELGASTAVKDEDLNTPLHMAVMGNHADIVRQLTTAGADSSVENAFGDTPKVIAANMGCAPEVVSVL
ncbi:ankyrin repeat-containing domain protein [Baffinella frigidus]|nr:ankyrin repeat-containing domain protein [Cryptophyta sp. CCMP2293]